MAPTSLIQIDNICDYIPIVSTISNITDIFLKYSKSEESTEFNSNHYYDHIQNKDIKRCVVLIVPVFGNIGVAIYDFGKYCQKKYREHYNKKIPLVDSKFDININSKEDDPLSHQADQADQMNHLEQPEEQPLEEQPLLDANEMRANSTVDLLMKRALPPYSSSNDLPNQFTFREALCNRLMTAYQEKPEISDMELERVAHAFLLEFFKKHWEPILKKTSFSLPDFLPPFTKKKTVAPLQLIDLIKALSVLTHFLNVREFFGDEWFSDCTEDEKTLFIRDMIRSSHDIIHNNPRGAAISFGNYIWKIKNEKVWKILKIINKKIEETRDQNNPKLQLKAVYLDNFLRLIEQQLFPSSNLFYYARLKFPEPEEFSKILATQNFSNHFGYSLSTSIDSLDTTKQSYKTMLYPFLQILAELSGTPKEHVKNLRRIEKSLGPLYTVGSAFQEHAKKIKKDYGYELNYAFTDKNFYKILKVLANSLNFVHGQSNALLIEPYLNALNKWKKPAHVKLENMKQLGESYAKLETATFNKEALVEFRRHFPEHINQDEAETWPADIKNNVLLVMGAVAHYRTSTERTDLRLLKKEKRELKQILKFANPVALKALNLLPNFMLKKTIKTFLSSDRILNSFESPISLSFAPDLQKKVTAGVKGCLDTFWPQILNNLLELLDINAILALQEPIRSLLTLELECIENQIKIVEARQDRREEPKLEALALTQKSHLEEVYAGLFMEILSLLKQHSTIVLQNKSLLNVIRAIDSSTYSIGEMPPPNLSEGSVLDYLKDRMLRIISLSMAKGK